MTVKTPHCTKEQAIKMPNCTKKQAISDSGMTGYFLAVDALMVNKRQAKSSINITLHNCRIALSTLACNLDLHLLSRYIAEAHIVSG